MIRIPVTSSDLKSVGYEASSQTLEIEFNSGGVYQYYGVPPQIYNSLLISESKGKFFHAYIKDKYQTRKIY